jgi:hypothetical protein
MSNIKPLQIRNKKNELYLDSYSQWNIRYTHLRRHSDVYRDAQRDCYSASQFRLTNKGIESRVDGENYYVIGNIFEEYSKKLRQQENRFDEFYSLFS